jgi:hypothetical protein
LVRPIDKVASLPIIRRFGGGLAKNMQIAAALDDAKPVTIAEGFTNPGERWNSMRS